MESADGALLHRLHGSQREAHDRAPPPPPQGRRRVRGHQEHARPARRERERPRRRPALKGPTGARRRQGRDCRRQGPDRLRQGERPEADGEGRTLRGRRRSTPAQVKKLALDADARRGARPVRSGTCNSLLAGFAGALERHEWSSSKPARRTARQRSAESRVRGTDTSSAGVCLTHNAPGTPGGLHRREHDMANATLSKDEILDAIGNMTVFELADLIEAFKTKFNVTIAAVAAARRPAAAARRPPRRPRSRPSSTVILKEAGAQEDPGHQGGPRDHRPGPQGSQGPGRRRAADRQGRRHRRPRPTRSRRSWKSRARSSKLK